MKHLLASFLLFCCVLALPAQTDGAARKRHFDDAFMRSDTLAPADRLSWQQEADSASLGLSLPWNAPFGFGAYGFDAPFEGFGVAPGAGWRLHEGLNARFSLGVSAAFGRHAPRGVGFGQTAAFAYVLPVASRLSVAAGIYTSNMDWGSWHRTDVGIAGMLAWQVSDRVNLYAYGAKSFASRATPFARRCDPFARLLAPCGGYWNRPADRIGAAAEFKIGNNAMIGVSVERCSY